MPENKDVLEDTALVLKRLNTLLQETRALRIMVERKYATVHTHLESIHQELALLRIQKRKRK
jgi:hypothetical protein